MAHKRSFKWGCLQCRAAGVRETFERREDLLEHVFCNHPSLILYRADVVRVCDTPACCGNAVRHCRLYRGDTDEFDERHTCLVCAKALVEAGGRVMVTAQEAGEGDM